jgi:hypothetical protein
MGHTAGTEQDRADAHGARGFTSTTFGYPYYLAVLLKRRITLSGSSSSASAPTRSYQHAAISSFVVMASSALHSNAPRKSFVTP